MSKYRIEKHPGHSFKLVYLKTISAQLHFLSLVVGLYGLWLFIAAPQVQGWDLVACCIFAIAGCTTMLVSSTYHFMSDGFKLTPHFDLVLENLDHFTIYFFIAGTYTPFLRKILAEPWRTYLLSAVWIIAILGVLYTFFKPKLPKWAQSRVVYTSIFLAMGWILIFRIGEAWTKMTAHNAAYLLLGGLSYSIGAAIYIIKKPNPLPNVFGFHEIWHVAVSIGFLFHYLLVYDLYVRGM